MKFWEKKLRLAIKWLVTSTLGVGILLFLLNYMFFRTKDDKNINVSDTPVSIEGGTVQTNTMIQESKRAHMLADTLTVEGVFNEVAKATPLRRDAVVRSFMGISVSWEGEIVSMKRRVVLVQETDSNLIVVSARTSDELHPSGVIFEINSTEYLGLELLREGQQIQFTGEIESVAPPLIWLSNASMTY